MIHVLLALLVTIGSLEVRRPSLAGLEAPVAAQLREIGERLSAEAASPRPSGATYGEAGRHYHAYEMLEAAEDCYRNAERLAADDFRWPYLLALVLEQAQRPEEAALSYKSALGKAAYYPAFVRLAALEVSLGRPADAEPALARARGHAPNDPALLAVLGEQALALGRPEEAARHLERALEIQPRATRLRYPLAMAYRSMGQRARAQAELAQSGTAGIRPNDPLLDEVIALRRGTRAHVLEAERATAAGDHAASIQAYRRALAGTSAPEPDLLLALAAQEARLNLYAEALAHLEEARRVAPEDASVLYNMALLLAGMGRPADAEPLLTRVLARLPRDSAARLELIVVLVALGRHDEAYERSREAPDGDWCGVLLRRLSAVPDSLRERVAPLVKRLREEQCASLNH